MPGREQVILMAAWVIALWQQQEQSRLPVIAF